MFHLRYGSRLLLQYDNMTNLLNNTYIINNTSNYKRLNLHNMTLHKSALKGLPVYLKIWYEIVSSKKHFK